MKPPPLPPKDTTRLYLGKRDVYLVKRRKSSNRLILTKVAPEMAVILGNAALGKIDDER
jgi:hypothetical protein